jgi:hypothetical protein
MHRHVTRDLREYLVFKAAMELTRRILVVLSKFWSVVTDVH